MKKLSTYLFLLLFSFQASSWADDIRDFEIEGMSVGDSLLDYYDEDEINNFLKMNYPGDDEYTGYEIPKSLSKIKFNTYDSITVHFKTNDKKMKIVSISGIKLYPNKLEKCLKDRDRIAKEIKDSLNNPVEDEYTTTYGDDNNSKGYTKELTIEKGSIRFWCNDWDKKWDRAKYWKDDLNVSIDSEELLYWVFNKAY